MSRPVTQRKVKSRSERNVTNPPRLRAPGRREQVAARRAQAVALRTAGATYAQIAKANNVSLMQSHRDVRRAMAEIVAAGERDTETLVAIELERLDQVLRAMTAPARDGDARAAGVLVRASESRRKLLGLDAAQRVELTGKAGGAILMRDADRPYEGWTDEQIFARLETVREQLRETIADEALRQMADGVALTPLPFPETPEQRYERALAERNAQRRTN